MWLLALFVAGIFVLAVLWCVGFEWIQNRGPEGVDDVVALLVVSRCVVTPHDETKSPVSSIIGSRFSALHA